mgnify:CR=1 FL=1
MKGVLRQYPSAESHSTDHIILGNLSLFLASYRVTVAGRLVQLTAREFDLLRVLSQQPDRIVPFEVLAEEVLGASDRPAIRHLNVLVHRTRAKLWGMDPYVLETVRFRGYGLPVN